MSEARQIHRRRWVPVLGVILFVSGCQLPAELTDSVSSASETGIQMLQFFVQDFARQMLAGLIL